MRMRETEIESERDCEREKHIINKKKLTQDL